MATTEGPPLGSAKGGIKLAITFPTLAQFDGAMHNCSFVSGSFQETFYPWIGTFGASGSTLLVGLSHLFAFARLNMNVVNGAAAGNLIIQGAKVSANATPTVFRKTSWARYKKLN